MEQRTTRRISWSDFAGKSGAAGFMLCAGLLLSGCMEESGASSATGERSDNRAPLIAGDPQPTVAVGVGYEFEPSADDRDGDPLTFAATGVPGWASFDPSTGRLSGTPTMSDVGMYPSITIAVSDGVTSVSLPAFDVQVLDPARVRKSNPGHYISMNRYDNDANLLEAAQQPGVRGIQKRYYWKELETSYGNYDFSRIQADLELVASQGKMLVVFVEDKTFNGEIPTPPYLQADWTVQNRNGGYTSIRWEPYVAERFSMLLDALGKNIDSHPAFEGVAIQESSLSLGDPVLDTLGYTPEKYRDSLIDVLTAAAQSFPVSTVFWYMNYLPREQSYLAHIAAAIAPYGVAMGGPDVLPDSEPLSRLTYPLYDEFQDSMMLFNSMQYDSYRHRHADTSFSSIYWNMNELFEFARDELHVSYLFWTRKSVRDPADSYMWLDALPVIRQNPSIAE